MFYNTEYKNDMISTIIDKLMTDELNYCKELGIVDFKINPATNKPNINTIKNILLDQ